MKNKIEVHPREKFGFGVQVWMTPQQRQRFEARAKRSKRTNSDFAREVFTQAGIFEPVEGDE